MTTNVFPNLKDVKQIIAISSCKGGVGKSTIAAHLAQELTNRGNKVGLVDADIYGPSVPTLFNLHNPQIQTNEQKHLMPVKFKNLKLMSFGFLLGDAPAVMRGPIVTRYIQQMLLNTEWSDLDYLLIDMPPGTGDVHLTITQTIRLTGAIIITTPHTLSLIDVARGILMFGKVSVPILGIVENMSYFQTDDDNIKHFIFGQDASKSLKEQFGVEILQQIPILPKLTATLSEKPLANTYIMDLADRLLNSLSKNESAKLEIPNVYCDDEAITLKWPDGNEDKVSNSVLRLNSQDALSVSEMTGEKLIKPEDIPNDIHAKKVVPLGNYAIGIEWSDGHDAGIYPYKLIQKLAAK